MKITIERVGRVNALKRYFFSFKTQAGDPREILHLGVERAFKRSRKTLGFTTENNNCGGLRLHFNSKRLGGDTSGFSMSFP